MLDLFFCTSCTNRIKFANFLFRKVCYGEGLRALRKFLPRPYFVQTEGALEKFLMVINSHEEILPLVSMWTYCFFPKENNPVKLDLLEVALWILCHYSVYNMA